MSQIAPSSSEGILGAAFQQERPYLFAVAYRMTGSASDAEDLVQDAWIRYYEAGHPAVTSLRAYLTRIVSNLALDYLKSARVKREAYTGPWLPEPVATADALPGPAETIEQREQVSLALLTLLEQLSPDQRVVYVLREGFGIPYDEIATWLEKPAATCRQLFRRAETRLSQNHPHTIAPPPEHQAVIEQLMTAVSAGNVADVVALLTDDAVWTSDGGGVRLAAQRAVIGADKVARGLIGINRKYPELWPLMTYAPVDINGAPGLAFVIKGHLERVVTIDVEPETGQVRHVMMTLNPEKLTAIGRLLGLPAITTWEFLQELLAEQLPH